MHVNKINKKLSSEKHHKYAIGCLTVDVLLVAALLKLFGKQYFLVLMLTRPLLKFVPSYWLRFFMHKF